MQQLGRGSTSTNNGRGWTSAIAVISKQTFQSVTLWSDFWYDKHHEK
jgi:hypothetical protein